MLRGVAEDLRRVLRGSPGLAQLPELAVLEGLAEGEAEEPPHRPGVAFQPGEIALAIGLQQAAVLEIDHGQDGVADGIEDRRAEDAVGASRQRRGARGLRAHPGVLDQLGTAARHHSLDQRGAHTPHRIAPLAGGDLLRRELAQGMDGAQPQRLRLLDHQQQRLLSAEAPRRGLERGAQRRLLAAVVRQHGEELVHRAEELRIIAARRWSGGRHPC